MFQFKPRSDQVRTLRNGPRSASNAEVAADGRTLLGSTDGFPHHVEPAFEVTAQSGNRASITFALVGQEADAVHVGVSVTNAGGLTDDVEMRKDKCTTHFEPGGGYKYRRGKYLGNDFLTYNTWARRKGEDPKCNNQETNRVLPTEGTSFVLMVEGQTLTLSAVNAGFPPVHLTGLATGKYHFAFGTWDKSVQIVLQSCKVYADGLPATSTAGSVTSGINDGGAAVAESSACGDDDDAEVHAMSHDLGGGQVIHTASRVHARGGHGKRRCVDSWHEAHGQEVLPSPVGLEERLPVCSQDTINVQTCQVGRMLQQRLAEPTEDAEELFCFCRQPYSEDGDLMIECETCEEWYHFKCVNLTPAKAKKIKVYLCRACETPAPAAASYWSSQIEATAVQPRARRTVLDDGCSKSTVQPATAQPTHTHPPHTHAQPPHAQPTPAPPTVRTAPAPPTSAPPRARAAPAQPTIAQPTRTSTRPTSAQFGNRNRKRKREPLDGEETAPNGDQLLGPTSNTVGTVAVVAAGEFKFPMLPTTTVITCALLGLL